MERKTLREWVGDIGSSGLMDIIATKFSAETWESEFDLEGASEMLDDVLSDLNLPPFAATIAKEDKADIRKRSPRPKGGHTRRVRKHGRPH